MKTAYIMDNVFLYAGAKSVSLWGDNMGTAPTHFTWQHGAPETETVWFSDACVYAAPATKCKRKIAWLCEPPPFRQGHYDFVKWHENEFDYVLTFDERLLKGGDPKYLYYPMGGSFISKDKWRKYPKVKLVSLVISNKLEATGHKLRHEIARDFGDRVDVMGSGVGEYVSKFEAMRDYMFTLCIESENLNWFFNDKLVDAFAMRTIPIYWGCKDLWKFFDLGGILHFETQSELSKILLRLTPDMYFDRLDHVENNFYRADEYFCAEDWIYEHYPFLFE